MIIVTTMTQTSIPSLTSPCNPYSFPPNPPPKFPVSGFTEIGVLFSSFVHNVSVLFEMSGEVSPEIAVPGPLGRQVGSGMAVLRALGRQVGPGMAVVIWGEGLGFATRGLPQQGTFLRLCETPNDGGVTHSFKKN